LFIKRIRVCSEEINSIFVGSLIAVDFRRILLSTGN